MNGKITQTQTLKYGPSPSAESVSSQRKKGAFEEIDEPHSSD